MDFSCIGYIYAQCHESPIIELFSLKLLPNFIMLAHYAQAYNFCNRKFI